MIISLLYREVSTRHLIDYARFFTRRVKRILPALSLVTSLTVVAGWFWLNPLGTQQVTASTAVGAALSVANWVIMVKTGDYFAEEAETNPLLHTWSLSVEEQFYLVFPFLLALAWWWGRRARSSSRTRVLVLLTALGIASFVAAWLLTGPLGGRFDSLPAWGFYSSFARVWEFAVGGLLAVGVQAKPWISTGRLRVVAIAGLLAIGVSLFVINGATPNPGPMTLLPVLGTAAVIYAGSGYLAGHVRWLSSRPMVWLGDLSYSWYLWHWPAIVFAGLLSYRSTPVVMAAAFGSLIPSWISFHLLEQPIRRSSVRGWRALGLAVVCIGIPVVLALALAMSARNAVDKSTALLERVGAPTLGVLPSEPGPDLDIFTAAVQAQTGAWDAFDTPCLGDRASRVGTCTFFEAPGKERVVLVGDSHAGAHSPGFLVAANELGMAAEVITSPGCPFNAVDIAYRGLPDTQCAKRRDEILRYLRDDPPDLLVVANRSPRFVNPEIRLADELEPDGDPKCVADAGSGSCLSHDEAVDRWARGLDELFAELQGQGTKVALLQTVPENERGLLQCIQGQDVNLGCLNTPRTVSWDRREDVIGAEAAVAAARGVPLFDPFDTFCDEATCHQYFSGSFFYRNDDHLSFMGSESLSDEYRRLINRAMRS